MAMREVDAIYCGHLRKGGVHGGSGANRSSPSTHPQMRPEEIK